MTAPDFASVLAAHAQYNAKRHPDDRWRYDGTHVCACGAEFKATRGIGGAIIAHRAHVAAALHAEMVAAQAEAWDEGHAVGIRPYGDHTNPYRAALAALAQAGGGEPASPCH